VIFLIAAHRDTTSVGIVRRMYC